MAITFVANGTWTAGTTSIVPPLPAGMAAGDIMLLVVHTPNQAVTTPSGWTLVTGSPVSTGTSGAAGGTMLNVYYRFWQSGDTAPTVSVTGGLVTNGMIFGYRGVHQTTPLDATPVATTLATASTTLTWNGITTVTANALIFLASARDQDLNSSAAVASYVNANLTSITERWDQVVNTSVGGGICVADGFKATVGATGNTTATQTSSIACSLTIALRPAPNAYSLTAQGGSYSLAGQSALVLKSEYLTASGGSYSLAGSDAVITKTAAPSGYTLTAQGGSYSLSGQSAVLSRNRNLITSGGSYSLSGQNAILLRSKRLTASSGSYSLTGSSVLITYQAAAANYQFTLQGGSYAISGSQAMLSRSKVLSGGGGTYSLSGANATLSRNRSLVASGGSYVWTGSQITLLKTGQYWPAPSEVLLGVQYGPTGIEYTGTLDLGKKIRLDIATGNLVYVLDGKKVISL